MRMLILFLMILAVPQSSWGQEISNALKAEATQLGMRLQKLQSRVDSQEDQQVWLDAAIYAKAAQWQISHQEISKKSTIKHLEQVLKQGDEVVSRLEKRTIWKPRYQPGMNFCGYLSEVDGSVQPYALTLPEDYKSSSRKRLPLYVVLHGRSGLNETAFLMRYAKRQPEKNQDWIQLDVFGRVDNAYRWAGETDVFEAMKDVKQRFLIDDQKIALWGFSMGGAGAWHMALHHPDLWAAAGAGAGFVDFYKYQKKTEPLSFPQHELLRIYDTVNYAPNLSLLPMVSYGGELDKQLQTSLIMQEAAKQASVPMKLIVGPQMGHKFDPESKAEFMAFLKAGVKKGRPRYPNPKSINFQTFTTKYNRCFWLTIHEMEELYQAANVSGEVNKEGVLWLDIENIAALSLARSVAQSVVLDASEPFELNDAADGLLPDVYFVKEGETWRLLSYDESRQFQDNSEVHKRKNLQGPIDDAFMQPFVCVTGTGTSQSSSHQKWAESQLQRFQKEYDKWMRASVPTINANEVSDELMQSHNLALFGDPSSNPLLRKVIDDLPIEWTKNKLVVNDQQYDPNTHALVMIYPNPLSPGKYVVLNTGMTMSEKNFKASNSYLFPKLGDYAVIRFADENGPLETPEVLVNGLFDREWQF